MFRPQLAFALVLSLYPLKQLIGSYLPIFMRVSLLFNVIVFAAVFVAVLTRFTRRERPTAGLLNGLTVVTLILYAYATFALLWTPGNGVARWMDGYAYWVMNVALLPLALSTVADFRKVLVPILIVGVIVAVLFYVNPKASWYSGRFTIYIAGRGTGDEIRANPLAVGQFGGSVAIVAALMLSGRVSLLINALRVVAILTGLGLAVTSGSRAQAVFAMGTMVLFYPLARPIKNLKQFILTAGGGVFLLAMMGIVFELFLGHQRGQAVRWNVGGWGEQIVERFGDAALLLKAYIASPESYLQGLGTNAFSYVSGFGGMSYAHNAPIEMLCELGLIGLTLYLIATVLAFKWGRQLFRDHKEEPLDRAAAAVLLALTFYAFTLSQKQYTFVAMPEPWWLWIIMAKLAVHRQRQLKLEAWHDDGIAEPDADHVEATDEHEPRGAVPA
jgi:hypothetical protein